MTKPMFFWAFISLLFFSFSLHAEGITVSETASSGSFPLVTNNTSADLVVDNNDAEVVKIVAQAFRQDVKLLTGVVPAIKTSTDNTPPIIIGTLGKSALIDQLATNGKINKTRLEGKWETFCISVVNNPMTGVDRALVIAGSDPRGTAFGVFELSRIMGVSPWVWWADVIPETRQAIHVSGDELFGPPSVKYRGMFINDEDFGMKPWAAAKMDPGIRGNGSGDIGPNTHKKIFELMLRTKSNYFWPAMHACTWAFWYYEQNRKVAQDYAIVLGSSHCEPMLRNNEDEWKRNFRNEYPGVTKGDFNWKTNSSVVKMYWTDRVKQSKGIDAVFTMGMRGVHDETMEGYSSDTERANAVKEIIRTQRDILEAQLEKPKNTISQLFCPYKEVLLQYNIGVDLPDDVALLWPDDNHGFIRQLSTPQEQQRSGGSGVYYHFSYWGPPQQSYLWLTSTSPVKTSFEMSKAYDMNAKNIWVFNVGDLKHAEFEYQFAMDLAWNVDAWRPEKAHQYMKFWANETFGAELADDIAEVQQLHYILSASGRPEHADWYAMTAFEMEQRLADYAVLAQKAKALESRIPARLKDAYFELITYPVLCTAAMNEKLLGAQLSFEYARTGDKAKAKAISEQAKDAYGLIQNLTSRYNTQIAGGKWNGMVSYDPRRLSLFYDPAVADEKTMQNEPLPAEFVPQSHTIPAVNFKAKSDKVKVIEQLGVTGGALTVLPFNMTQYTQSNISSAPSAEYTVQLNKGKNRIRVMCLPTFPLYPGLDLRYAMSIDGSTPQFTSIARFENDEEWRTNILRGYARGDVFVDSDSDKDVTVKIYFADPGLVLSGVQTTSFVEQENDRTHLLVNPDFEIDKNGNQLKPGTLNRGTPYGWTQKGSLKGNSYGTNQDAINFHGEHLCWYASDPMPADFELSQTVKGLPAGEYVVRCRLGTPVTLITTQRLFANDKVMYYGKESDYSANLTSGESNLFAGYTPGAESRPGTMMELREMALKVTISPGEDLKLGIRTSNQLSDGSSDGSGRSGWFKVDHFRLELVREFTEQELRNTLADLIKEAQKLYDSTVEGTVGGQYPADARSKFQTAINTAQSTLDDTSAGMAAIIAAVDKLKKDIDDYKNSMITFTSYIINASFEYKAEGVLNDGSTVRGTPYGWQDTGGILGNSFGINNDARNKDGNNACWYNSLPNFPPLFELYQNIAGLPAGEYTLRCKMSVPNNMITTQALFANNSIQYYGKESDYGSNIQNGNNVSFAGLSTSGDHSLQEMAVDVVLGEGDNLKLGLRTGNKKADGTEATNNAGWFKIDHFRLELKKLHGETGLDMAEENSFRVIGEEGGCRIFFEKPFRATSVKVVSLSGYLMYDNPVYNSGSRITLPKGLHVVVLTLDGERKTSKILVR